MIINEIFQVAIIGSGQLGSRHLQGLALSESHLKIYVIDPLQSALDTAQSRYLEMPARHKPHEVIYAIDMDSLPRDLDLVIVATAAQIRREVIESVLRMRRVKYFVLEKIVFQATRDLKVVKDLFDSRGVKAWVNCPRRLYSIYTEVKAELGKEVISISFSGDNWGMACNSIHFIDLLAFFSEELDMVFDTSQIDDVVYSSKRPGFSEIKGTLSINTSRGGQLKLMDNDNCPDNSTITITTPSITIIIDEVNCIITKTLHGVSTEDQVIIPYQSQLTGLLADSILMEGSSNLVSYDECVRYHIPMLDAFNLHLSKILKKEVIVCPIT